MLEFKKPILVYIPCHNCEKRIAEVLSEIPSSPSLNNKIECLVVDNQSQDRTAGRVTEEIKKEIYPFKISLIRPKTNLGYGGSQKLAYSIARKSPEVKYIIMMHGDGQYPPALLDNFASLAEKEYGLINAFRTRKHYGRKEETPLLTYFVIKTMSVIENLLTGFKFKEWQNGFVMYSCDFLRKVPLWRLSDDMQIDGELLICAGILKEKTHSVPIYKRYREFEALKGMPRFKYVLKVSRTISRFRKKYYHHMLENTEGGRIDFDFDILSQ